FRFARLAENGFNFGELPQQAVLDLQDFSSLTDGDARDGGRHKQDVTLVKRRHELLAQILEGKNRVEVLRAKGGHGGGTGLFGALGHHGPPRKKDQHDEEAAKGEREPTEAQNEMDEWLISPYEKTVNRVLDLWRNLPANEQHHQDRHERDPQ